MDAELRSLSRKARGDLETLHVVGCFAPEVTEEYVDLGLHRSRRTSRLGPPRSARPARG